METLDVSWVIPARNEFGYIEKHALPSLEEQDYPKDRFEVIVVDDVNVPDYDGTREVAESFSDRLNIRVIDQPEKRLGPGGARNVGLECSRVSNDKMVGFLDADTRASPNVTKILADLPMDIVGVGGPVYMETASFTDIILDIGFYMRNKVTEASINWQPLILGNMCGYRKGPLSEVMWKEGQRSGEDHYTSKRMGKMGDVIYVKDFECTASKRKIDEWGYVKSAWKFGEMVFAEINGEGISLEEYYVR